MDYSLSRLESGDRERKRYVLLLNLSCCRPLLAILYFLIVFYFI